MPNQEVRVILPSLRIFIGDIGTQEFGLSYFLDLAYDIEKWGHAPVSQSITYRKNWIKKQFATWFTGSTESRGTDIYVLDKILDDYTTLLAKRKHEVMNASVFHPVHFGEAQETLDTCNSILENCEALKSKCTENFMSAFVSLLYYPACGTANLFKMWILASRNKLYADQNRVEANLLADELPFYLQRDLELITTPVCFESKHYIGYSINDEKMVCINTVHQPDRPFFLSRQWEEEAISNIKIVKETVNLKKGLNTLKLYAVSPQIMIEKIVLHKTTVPLSESYLGPKESFIC